MKKIWVYMMCVTMCIGMLGCGADSAGQTDEKEAGVESTVEASEEVVESSAVEESVEESTEQVESSEPVVTEEPVTEIAFSEDFYDYESMADMLAEYGIRFGAAMSLDSSQDYTMQSLVGQHFNSVTATNEMKAYCLLDANASRKSEDGMPVMDFSGSIPIIEAAANNGAQVRGHVLVWDANMTDWFFREGYKSNGDYVDRETMKKRLESYITQVINFYEENYPGVVYCWDVVNEAVGDNSSQYNVDDERHVRTHRNEEENPFYKYVGEDYVELSFLYARNAVEALQEKDPNVDIKLFYNDYSTFHTEKRDAICKLVESINSYATDADGNPRKLIDGVGMQGYIGGYGTQGGCMDFDDITRITDAIEKFASLGVEVQITEMAVRNYSDSLADVDKHALFYKKLMEALVEVNSGDEKPLTCIAIWGLTDMGYIDESSYSYKMNGPYCGLFTPGYYVKDAFHDVYVMLKEKSAEN